MNKLYRLISDSARARSSSSSGSKKLLGHSTGVIRKHTAKKEIQKGGLKALQGHDWTGNIRELRNVVERLVIMSEKEITEADVKKYGDLK